MASPVASALAKLDGSVQAFRSQLDRLQAALGSEDEQLRHSLTEACHDAATVCDLLRAERPDADWADRAALDQLIHDLGRAAGEKRNQQRREKVLDLADELAAGSVQHRSALRAAALNASRLQAVEELRKEALGESVKDLPGPKASEWLQWACSLQDGADARLLEELRRDFPVLERFSGELEERYWRPPTGKAPEPSQPEVGPAQKSPAVVSEAPSRRETVWRSELAPHWSASTAAVIIPPSDPPSHLPPAKDSQNQVADASPAENAAAAHDAHLTSTLQVATVPQPVEQASPQAAPETEEQVFSSFGQSASRERHVALWIAVASVVALCAAFAGIHYFHGRGNRAPATASVVQDSDLNVARAATSGEAATLPGTTAPDSNLPMAGANLTTQTAGEKSPAAPTVEAKLALPMLHRQPDEGAQNKILLSMEFCQRANPAGIECWGYVSNLGSGGSRVSLDRVDVVDSKGNTFSLDKNGQFEFPNGKSSSIPAGSRVKYALKVPDKDPAARTLTLYLDISNPIGLEYTFRDVPVAE